MIRRNKGLKSIVAIVLILMMLMSSTAMAEIGKTVEVKGYYANMLSPEERAEITGEFSVSNVVEALDPTIIGDNIDEYLIADSPAVITTLKDYPAIFEVYKLFKEDGEYKFHYDEVFPVDGEVLIFVPDETSELTEYGYADYIEKIVHISKLTDEQKAEMEFTFYVKGATVTLTEPGDYYVIFRFEAADGSAEAFITVKDPVNKETPKPETPKEEPKEEGIKASPTSSKVLVNGEEVEFDAYLIEDNNYFKLRDIAHVISGSEKQFEVNWDGEKKAINLISNEAYTSVGEEMIQGDQKEKSPKLNESKIYKDGEEVELTAYNIEDNNYFKLRDLGEIFNFGIGWNNDIKTININTSDEYIIE